MALTLDALKRWVDAAGSAAPTDNRLMNAPQANPYQSWMAPNRMQDMLGARDARMVGNMDELMELLRRHGLLGMVGGGAANKLIQGEQPAQ